MKKIALLLLVGCLVYIQGFSQETQPQPQVKTRFGSLYPGSTKVKWVKEDEGYEAHFELNKVEMSATFDAKGNLIQTEKEIPLSELPMNVVGYVAKNFGGQKIKESAEITAANGIITYEAEINEGDLIFDREGQVVKFIKKDAKKEKGEKEDDKD